MKSNPAESVKIVAEETQISEADVKKMLPWYNYSSKITDTDLADLAATHTFLKENDMLTNAINIKDLVSIIP